MDENMQNRILEFLKSTYDYEGTIHFLALSAKEAPDHAVNGTIRYKLRITMTFKEAGEVCPYFDGTELLVDLNPDEIRFAAEDERADGPPIMEGSPNALALPWVSELAPPFFVSPEAQEAVKRALIDTVCKKTDVNTDDFF